MDWPSIILATFLIGIGVIVIFLTAIVFYRLSFQPIIGDIKDPVGEKRKEQIEEIEANKIGNWIAPYFGIASLGIILWKSHLVNPALAAAITFPSLLGSWFVIRFKSKQERTGIVFSDIFRHPAENFGLFLFFCFIVFLCLIFVVPMLILAYG